MTRVFCRGDEGDEWLLWCCGWWFLGPLLGLAWADRDYFVSNVVVVWKQVFVILKSL